MELIKRIKDAESQAAEIIATAKAGAASQGEQFRKTKNEQLEQGQLDRKQAIDKAVAEGEKHGQAESEKLSVEAKGQREQMRQRVSPKIDAATAKVMEYLKG